MKKSSRLKEIFEDMQETADLCGVEILIFSDSSIATSGSDLEREKSQAGLAVLTKISPSWF